jgi:hypothetical protein
MPIVADTAQLQHPPGRVIPLRLVPRYVDMQQPLSDFAVGYLAAQLVAAYGNDALPLAVRYANEIVADADTTKLANWCLVICTLEEQALANQIAKLQRIADLESNRAFEARDRRG